MGDSQPLLDPAAIARGESLEILARLVVEGYRAGDHRSLLHGFAIEFAQHREYTVGDDMRHIDWKVFGRTDRYYVKRYEQETNFIAHLLLDGSESMTYGSGPVTKLDYAKALAACLAYLILRQRDAVSLSIFDSEVRRYLPRTDNFDRIHEIMHQLASFQATGQTGIPAAMDHLAEVARRRRIIVILSDLLEDEEGFERGLHQLRFQDHEILVFQVLDPQEIEFSFPGQVRFIGLEGGPVIETSPAALRDAYLQEMNAHQARLRDVCLRTGCHYILANTAVPLADTLGHYLLFRQQVRRR